MIDPGAKRTDDDGRAVTLALAVATRVASLEDGPLVTSSSGWRDTMEFYWRRDA